MKELIIWFTVWTSIWVIFNTIVRWPLEKLEDNKYFGRKIFFLLATTLVYLNISQFLRIQAVRQLVTAFLLTSVIGIILAYTKRFYQGFNKDRFFMFSQSSNILFQQIMILWGISISGKYFGLLFLFAHTPILLAKWDTHRYLALGLSFIGGTFFSYLYQNFTYGTLMNFAIHYIIYIIWIYKVKDEEKI